MTEPCPPAPEPREPAWSAATPAVHVERAADGDGRLRVSVVSHPTQPYTGEVSGHDDRFAFGQLLALAEDYLGRLAEGIDADGPLPDAARALKARQPSGFAWLGLAAHEGDEADGRQSFPLDRQAAGEPADAANRSARTWVLLAGNQHQDGGRQLNYGGRIGLRVVAHLGPVAEGQRSVRITGASSSAIDLAWTAQTGPVRIGQSIYHPRDGGFPLEIFIEPIARALGFDMISIDGLSLSRAQPALFISGTASRQDKGRRVHAWGVRIPLQRDDQGEVLFTDDIRIEQDYRIELASHLISGFGQDPASSGPSPTMQRRAPTRDSIDALRTPPAALPNGAANPFVLEQADPADASTTWVTVRASRLGGVGQAAPQAVAHTPGVPPEPPLRSDDLAAVQAWQRGTELFERITAYGLKPVQLFRLAGLPLVMRHHDALPGANDGRTVNARVGLSSPALPASDPFQRSALPLLEITFGAASLSHWNIERRAGSHRPEPLGLAADPRWAWHEFGHVLCYGSTGDIELPFAHSAGDALAAIVADPDSALRDPQTRHITFPWVRTGRRHDRPAPLGWCWCGRRNTRRQPGLQRRPMSFTGYFAEQLLSSSLFRAYRCLGGDTDGPTDQRQRASDYLVYLVMSGTALLGAANTVPAATADHFVSALIDADIGTHLWQVARTWGSAPPSTMRRTGGTAHKVLRWAFEQQGLYAAAHPHEVKEGVGSAPEVDLFIPGRAARASGGYEPVPLAWDDHAPQPWHASATKLVWSGSSVRVTVGNRGRQSSGPLVLQVWTSDPGGLAWTAAAPVAHADIAEGQSVTLTASVAKAPSPGSVVLAVVTCAADRANSDPAAGLPCAFTTPPTDPERLLDLVANDNNMGLRVI